MKSILISAFFLFQFSANAQIYVQLQNIGGAATFESEVDAGNLNAEAIHKATLQWIEETFLSADVITQNTPARIAAKFLQDYSTDTWSGQKEHNLVIDIKGNMAFFTISDTKLGLISPDGEWKKHLSNMRVMYEKAANDLFWSYESVLKKGTGSPK